MVAGRQRRLKVFCVTCSFAPDDLFFPLVVTAAIKGTWFIFSFAVCLNLFFQPGCADGISAALAVSAIGFTCLQLLAFVHKFVLLLTSARGTIREPNHTCVRELLLTGVAIYVVEVVWAVYSVVAVLTRVIDGGTPCERLRRPIAAYVILVWLNWLELAVLALVYFSCLDRCKCFFCHAVCSLHCRQNVTSQAIPNGDGNWNVEANIRVLPVGVKPTLFTYADFKNVWRSKVKQPGERGSWQGEYQRDLYYVLCIKTVCQCFCVTASKQSLSFTWHHIKCL
jgi:hypothetical protein